jgi:prepilin-type N-terminal cleavage/methylation domain-containing protein
LTRHGAFTLVELLVSISIISLLISLLLPSLSGAREQAKLVKCMAQQRQIGQAVQQYMSEQDGWLPGSPGTTGSSLLGMPTPLPGDAENTPGTAVTLHDWAGPLAAVQMGVQDRTKKRSTRLRELTEGVFACPSNNYESRPWYAGELGDHGEFKKQPMVSYNTLRVFTYWHPANRNAPFRHIGLTLFPWSSATPEDDDFQVSLGYAPRIEYVGTPANKVFLADGARFTSQETPGEGEYRSDHDITWGAPDDPSAHDRYGGPFSDGGPTIRHIWARSFHTDQAPKSIQRKTYRHSSKSSLGLVAMFMDGHCQYMTESETRFPPDPWFPKGTVIPFSEFNRDTRMRILEQFERAPDELVWRVKR